MTRQMVQVDGAELDVLVGGHDESAAATVCTAHPTESMDRALGLLADITQARVVCVNPRGVGGSSPPAGPPDSVLECMVDDLETVRLAIGVDRWVIWGMSGGSMIAQVYAHRHPHALAGLILDTLTHLRALHQAIPGSTFVAIEGAGHVPVVEKPAEVGAAVRSFLSQRVWA